MFYFLQGFSDGSRVVFRKLDEALSEPTISIGTQTDDSDDPTDDAEKAPMLDDMSLLQGKDSPDASTSNSNKTTAIKVGQFHTAL